MGRKVISELATRMAQNEPYFFIFRLAERENEGYFVWTFWAETLTV